MPADLTPPAAGTDQARTDGLRALATGHPDDFPCLPAVAICPCNGPTPCVVVRCGNCGTDAHAKEWSIAELAAFIEEHCAGGGDHG